MKKAIASLCLSLAVLFARIGYADQEVCSATQEALDVVTNAAADDGQAFRDLATAFYETVLGRSPEAGVIDAWEQGYYEVSATLDVDVRFVMREMGRQFFLSEEYAARERDNAEFIGDCYGAFLMREAQTWEIDAWVNDIAPEKAQVRWNRAQVMTTFAESIEFGGLIEGLFPDREGDPTRNYVTTLYIGILDRLSDTGGLTYWTGVMDADSEKKRAAKTMAKAFFESSEGQQKSPNNETKVIRLYRAFLGRFPADEEVQYWQGELDSKRETLQSLIEKFGDSQEFGGILAKYFLTVFLPGNVSLVMARIPSGSLQMGSPDSERSRQSSEGPVHTVNIAYDFYMGKHEVTQGQWRALMGSNPTKDYGVGDDYPVYHVSRNDIVGSGGFLDALNSHLAATGQAVAGKPFQLPSEAEWEYACRAGTQPRFYFGDSLAVDDGLTDGPAGTLPGKRSDYMWFGANNSTLGTKPVGGKLPNHFSLYDMSGNVWEWCQDRYHASYDGAPVDGGAWVAGGSNYWVLRGGSWQSTAQFCRSASRNYRSPDSRDSLVGFRLLRAQ